ncbi:hypothetical protein BRM3_02085 [Brachybacterium huguangmaarense]|uniref:DUF2567 domain-containing protein n=1 Tax=Brachybacterium huguangmaarense TaxID=1652028 RepID=A0ABY6G3N2_9MICO|nr:hypothetical protein [Brachybacterium huguangmaarense]UYG17248.1 hypothetical protein BRM3_02085 [Brachybacterium huguangmaarense]
MTGTAPQAGAERPDPTVPAPRPSRAPRITAVVLGVLAMVWACAMGAAILEVAHLTYWLPPPPGTTVAIERQTWNTSTLLLLPGAGLALLIALAGVVWALAVRRPVWPALAAPFASGVVATGSLLLAAGVPTPTF